MLSFNDHDNFKDIIKNLIEANIQEPRYPEGSMVVLKADKISAFNSKVSFTADASTVFTKVALNPEGSDETIGDGNPQVTLDVFSDADQNNKIRTITWAQNPNDYYNHEFDKRLVFLCKLHREISLLNVGGKYRISSSTTCK